MELILIVCAIVIATGVSATLIIVAYKWRIIEIYDNLRATNRIAAYLPKSCEFCLGFWLCLFQALFLNYSGTLRLEYYGILFIAFAGAGFTQKLLTYD